MANTGVKDNDTGKYLTGWNVYGEAEFKKDVKMANRMMHNVAANVVRNLNSQCGKDRYTTITLC